MDKREIVQVFRRRLGEAMTERGVSQSALSRIVGVDRSTLSQLLDENTVRMPRGDTVAAIGEALQVSTDWLLGLTSDSRFGAEILRQSLEVAAHEPSPADTNLARWYAESEGLKIRYVPSNIPDIFKTEALIDHEYGVMTDRPVNLAIKETRQQLDFGSQHANDLEICMPLEGICDLCRGGSIWRDLDKSTRLEQRDKIVHHLGALYPGVRIYLFNGLKRFSAPYTIFGNKRAVLYLGQMYFAFNNREYVSILIRHFDDLIRNADINAHEAASVIGKMKVV